MTNVRSQPCSACPYRRDCPAGLWSAEDYNKLPPYDVWTMDQPIHGFRCHATPDHYCCGWVIVHMSRGHEYELLALRIHWPGNDIPEVTGIAFFSTGTEAALHGLRGIGEPDEDALEMMERLLRKHPHLLTVEDD